MDGADHGGIDGLTQTLDAAAEALCAQLKAQLPRARILYAPGSGDVFGTFEYWSKGVDDARNPAIAYSHSFYNVAQALDAQARILWSGEARESGDGRFSFRRVVLDDRHKGLRYHLAELNYVLKVAAEIFRFRPQFIVQDGSLANLWMFAVYKLLGVKVVVSMHNCLWPVGRKRPSGLRRRLNAWFFRRGVDGVLCTGAAIKRQVEEIAGRAHVPIRVHIPQYRATRQFSVKTPPDTAGRGRPFHVVFVGRLEEDKGVFLMLEAARELAARYPGRFRWTFAGDGDDEASARRWAEANGLKDAANFLGVVDGDGVFALLSEADILACPTKSSFLEGLTKTPIEAALAGTPTIASDVVPTAELLGAGCVVFKADDAPALQDAIEAVAADPARLASMAAATRRIYAIVTDRSLSWSSQLAGLLAEMCPAPGTPKGGTRRMAR